MNEAQATQRRRCWPLPYFLFPSFFVLLTACSGVSEEQRVRSTREYELAVSRFRDEHDVPGALVSLERAIKLNPDNADAHLTLGILYGAAEQSLRKAVRLLTVEGADDPARLAVLGEAKNTLAAALVNLGRPSDAIPLLQDIIGDMHYQAQHLALANLGSAYLALGRFEEARSVLERAVSNRPEFCVGHFRLGTALFRLGQFEPALASLDRALADNQPACAGMQPAWRLRGELHAQLHQPDAARADFGRCQGLKPESNDGQFCSQALRTAGAP